MTAAFGRRNRAPAPPIARPAPEPDLVLTQAQRAYLFGGAETEAASQGRSRAGAREKPASPPVRRAGLIACAAITAVVAALRALGAHESAPAALAGIPDAVAPMSRQALALIGSGAGPLALVWSILVNFGNFSANLWLTRKISGALGVATLPAFLGLGAGLGFGVAWLSCVAGMGDSEIGYAMEALAGAGVAGLYWLLSGAARP
jgi:hypothetical protein